MKKSFVFNGLLAFMLASCSMESDGIGGDGFRAVADKSVYDKSNEVVADSVPSELVYEYKVKVGISELSGISLSKDGDFFWGIDDDGGLYSIKMNSKRKAKVTHIWKKSAEMEGLAMDPDGNLFIGVEDDNDISAYMIPYHADTNEYNFVNKKCTDYKHIYATKGTEDFDNDGAEGITWYKNGLYFGTQLGVNLHYYKFNEKNKLSFVSKKSLCDVKDSDGNKCDIDEIAGLDYDAINDRLWVVDSVKFKIYVFDGEANKLLASYYIGEEAYDNPEGLCVDIENNCVWVCEDIDGTSKIHKYSFAYK